MRKSHSEIQERGTGLLHRQWYGHQRLKNVEISDEIKKLPFEDYKLDVWKNGVITFKIRFKEGVLPDVWSEPRKPKKRGSKAAELAPQQIAYNITGDRRKALVEAVADYTGGKAIYQNAPTFAYSIGTFTVDKNGTLSGPIDYDMIRWLMKDSRPKHETRPSALEGLNRPYKVESQSFLTSWNFQKTGRWSWSIGDSVRTHSPKASSDMSESSGHMSRRCVCAAL